MPLHCVFVCLSVKMSAHDHSNTIVAASMVGCAMYKA